MALMFIYADDLAILLKDYQIAPGIRVLAPAVFFSCFISVYRGYFQGYNEMVPTAVSQLLEVGSKLVFGLLIAWLLLQGGASTGIASAGSNMGSTIGLALCIPVMIVWKHRFDRRNRLRAAPDEHARSSGTSVVAEILRVSIPITLGASILNILTFVDAKVVLTQLEGYLSVKDATALYGVYSKGLSIFHLPSSLAAPIAVSIVPVIAAAMATNRRNQAKEITESSLKLTNLIGMPAAVGMFVLATPIFRVLFWNSNPVGPELLSTFAIASYFMCMQLVTIGILQANGYEKVPLVTCTLGGLLQIALDWYLTSIPSVNITGSPFGTLTCYGVITVANLLFMLFRFKEKPDLSKVFLKPALCAAVTGVCAWAVYELLCKIGARPLGAGHLATAIYLLGAIVISILVYAILILATKTVTRDDLKLIPKGERLANLLKIK